MPTSAWSGLGEKSPLPAGIWSTCIPNERAPSAARARRKKPPSRGSISSKRLTVKSAMVRPSLARQGRRGREVGGALAAGDLRAEAVDDHRPRVAAHGHLAV